MGTRTRLNCKALYGFCFLKGLRVGKEYISDFLNLDDFPKLHFEAVRVEGYGQEASVREAAAEALAQLGDHAASAG